MRPPPATYTDGLSCSTTEKKRGDLNTGPKKLRAPRGAQRAEEAGQKQQWVDTNEKHTAFIVPSWLLDQQPRELLAASYARSESSAGVPGPSSSAQHCRSSRPRARARPHGCSCCQPLLALTQPTAQPGLLAADFWAAAVAAFRSTRQSGGVRSPESADGSIRTCRVESGGGGSSAVQHRDEVWPYRLAGCIVCSLAAQGAGVLMASTAWQLRGCALGACARKCSVCQRCFSSTRTIPKLFHISCLSSGHRLLAAAAAAAAAAVAVRVYVQRVAPALRGEGRLAFPSRGLRRRRGAALQAAQHGNQLQRGVLWTPRSRRDQQTGAGVRPRAAAEGQGSCSRAGPCER